MRLNSLSHSALVVVLLLGSLSLTSCNNNKSEAPSDDPSSQNIGPKEGEIGPLPPHEASLPKGDVSYKRYALKQAHIHYETSGFRRGTEDLYFTDYGMREARHVNVENLTEEGIRPEKVVVVSFGSDMRMANLTNSMGTWMKEPVVDSLLHVSKVDPPGVISDSILSKMQYKKQGTSTILGRPVTIWFEPTSGTTLHTWEGLVLKQEVKNPQHQHVVEAVSIDTAMPPAEVFVVPDTIKYMKVDPRAPRR
jgi:hypothetical protein